MNSQLEPAPATTPVVQPPATHFSLMPTTYSEAREFAELLASSDMVPTDVRGKPANCLIAWQLGANLGVNPLQALWNIAVINGRPCIWGDLIIAVVRASGQFVERHYKEKIEGDGDARTAFCQVCRKGGEPTHRTFSIAQAKHAGLIGKNRDNVWKTYPDDMLMWRARSRVFRPVFADVLMGVAFREDLEDAGLIDVTPQTDIPGTTEGPLLDVKSQVHEQAEAARQSSKGRGKGKGKGREGKPQESSEAADKGTEAPEQPAEPETKPAADDAPAQPTVAQVREKYLLAKDSDEIDTITDFVNSFEWSNVDINKLRDAEADARRRVQ